MELIFTKKKILIVVIFIAALFFGVTEYTTKPSFCKSCHVMEPYVHRWEISVHKEIECLTCHSEPGITGFLKTKINASLQPLHYLTKTYTMPSADVPTKNCLKCHENILFEKVGEKFVRFPHEKHVIRQNLNCNRCHSGAAVTHIDVDMPICLECHNNKKAPFKCETCHSDIGKREFEWEVGVTFVHEKHLDKGFNCELCHATYVEERRDLYMESLCAYCHDIKTEDKCNQCHENPPPYSSYKVEEQIL